MNADIYTINADGSGLANVTNTNALVEREPDWSPDGTKFAYHDGTHISVMNADGSNPTQITGPMSNQYEPGWSPDGTRIAYTSYETGYPEIFAVNPDGSQPVNLTNDVWHDGTPSWSPDGRIAFTTNRHASFRSTTSRYT